MTSSVQPTRDRKNNDSFFINIFNLASNKKETGNNTRDGKESALNNTTDLRLKKQMNSSGFFVFNEEDMKNMTEMSPRNKTSKDLRSISLHIDY